MMTIPTILMYLCIPFFGNGAYFLAYGDNSPECGMICLIFFNISFFTLFIPLLFRNVKDSSYLKKGQMLFSVWYLIIESIIAFLFIKNDGSPIAALVTQFMLLGIFLISLFGLSSANEKTDRSLREFDNNRSQDLIQARINLQIALISIKKSSEREKIYSLISSINSSPILSKPETKDIERLICEKTASLDLNTDTSTLEDINNLLNQRKLFFY